MVSQKLVPPIFFPSWLARAASVSNDHFLSPVSLPMETARGSGRSLVPRLENPFSFKVAQVFTGFGIGCGVGIGVGRPIYLGAIPAVQQVLTAARGATDAFSGVGRHVNGSLKKLGLKNIEVGIGCGVGFGHGFGVGLAVKPGVVNQIQNSFGQVMAKVTINLGRLPVLSSIQGPGQSNVDVASSSPAGHGQPLTAKVLDSIGENTLSTITRPTTDERLAEKVGHNSYSLDKKLSEKSVTSRTEKVISSFLQDPLFKDAETEINKVAGDLQLENNVLQVLLKHQRVIEELIEENKKLQQVLVEELKVPPSKLQAQNNHKTKDYYPCSDCFECRRRRRKSTR